MLSEALELLACPHCGAAIAAAGATTVGCVSGHRFDLARQGYLALFTGAGPRGDDTQMVAARDAFLASGHYVQIAEALAREAAATGCRGPVLDVGAGTGYHLARVVGEIAEAIGIALDASPAALRRTARADARITAIGADAWNALPLRDGAFALALTVFAPRNGPELARVLKPDGVLLVVTPTDDHLGELIEPLGLLTVDPGKAQRIDRQLSPHFDRGHQRTLVYTLALDPTDLSNVALMGPSAHHTDRATLEANIAKLPNPFEATASVNITHYRSKPEPPAPS